jgi:hypothetical protein
MESGSRQALTQCPPEYIKTVPGILKIVEMVLCLITFACSLGGYWSPWGGGWVEFVAMSCFITTLLWFILHLVFTSLPGLLVNRPWEFVVYCIMGVLFLISGIVAAARAPYHLGAVGATAFFALAATLVYGVDIYFQFRGWRSTSHSTTTTTTTTATVTTTSASSPSSRVQY